jgi:hypothetical protein
MAVDHMGDSLAHPACRSGYYYLYHLCSFICEASKGGFRTRPYMPIDLLANTG